MKASAREKKILYAGIAVAAVILIYYVATSFSPGGGESLADKVATQESLLIRQRELIGREDFYKKRIEDAEDDLAKIQTRLLPGNDASTAVMELQRVLEDFAERSGVIITTRTPMPERKVADSDSMVKVSVRVGLDCTLEDLVDFLTAVKNYDKFLKVDDIQINTNLTQRQYVIRRPLNMVIAGYISVAPPEPAANDDESLVQATLR